MICGAGFRHTSLSSLPGVSPPASSASSGETLLAANTTFRLSGTLQPHNTAPHCHHRRRGAVRRYVSLNAHGYLTCSLERSGHIGHGYESSEACGDLLHIVLHGHLGLTRQNENLKPGRINKEVQFGCSTKQQSRWWYS